MKIELGQVDNQPIDPVELEIPETAIAQIAATLKDSAKRQQFFFNQDNSLNIANVVKAMLRDTILDSADKALYLKGADKQVEIFEKTFPGRSAKEVGLGSGTGKKPTPQKGVIVSAGKPEVVRLQNN